MDLRESIIENSYPKCDKCQMTWYVTNKIGNKVICTACLVKRFCGICKTTVIRLDSPSEYCHECWNALQVSKITPGVFISDHVVSKNYDLLKSHGIKQILTIGTELEPHDHPDFKAMYIALDDSVVEDIRQHFDQAHEFIARAPTLVHCYAGISRSATLVISYVMKHKKMTLKKALKYCRSKRCVIDPNPGFISQLLDYEKELGHYEWTIPELEDDELQFAIDDLTTYEIV